MSADSLDTLLVKLTSGEQAAAERVFRDYEPLLRSMVRRRLTPALRAKFDSMDVVQSVWADVLEGYQNTGWRFTNRDHLRAFLARVTLNHFFTYCRRHGPATEREQPFPEAESAALAAARQPRPSQLAQADELWQKMLRTAPPAHREVLVLKRHGLSLDEIAARSGLHPSSVRRILYETARRLALQRGRPSAAGPAGG